MKRREIAFRELGQENTIAISPFDQKDAGKWDRLVLSSNNGTVFHSRKFLSYHPPERFRDGSLVFKREGKWLAVMPCATRVEDGGKVLHSHPGASMAGPVFRYGMSIKDTFCVVEALARYLGEQGYTRCVLTLPPQIYHARPSNYLEFALLESGFTYDRREISSVIPLDFAEEDTLLSFSPESRRAIRKALKQGVEVRESDDFGAFYAILKRNLNMRHNVQPTHTLDELLLLKDLLQPNVKLFAAFHQGGMAAGIVLFICNPRVALAFYISHREELQALRSVNLLFYEVVCWCIRNRFKFVDFGLFTVRMKPNWGLAKFKESFGAQGVFRDSLVKIV